MQLLLCRHCLAGFALIFICFNAHAGDEVHLFQALSEAMPAPGAGAVSEHLAALDVASLRDATRLLVNIPSHHYAAEREDFESRPGEGFRWYGRIDAANDILITSDGHCASITIDGTNGRWRVRPFGVGGHPFTTVDTSFAGLPAGIPNQRDNARTARLLGPGTRTYLKIA